ncbi:MAG TPA: pyrroloquinoline quinone biosynthesis protein PqqB [Gemmatimonadales bacterium]|nr:pyrroloquinoline quinone biosynthesis protein PqqB [Gemmatimonadales bacterium]
MQVILLGTAAGGGFPQWNCWCPTCRIARREPARARPRSQSSAAVSADGRRWFLLNASPDVHAQLARIPGPEPRGMRHVPIEGVVLTDAELDHTLGIVLLREGRYLQLYATPAAQSVIERDSSMLPVTRAFAEVRVEPLAIGGSTALGYRDGCPAGLTVTAFPVPAGPPRFASEDLPGHTVGLLVRDDATGGVCAFVPGCGGLDRTLLDRLAGAELVLFDGTFWTDDELIALGIGQRTARAMDHLPVSGPDGSLEQLAALPARHRVYTHINNTNPMLIEDSPQRLEVERHGLVVGADGMRFTL